MARKRPFPTLKQGKHKRKKLKRNEKEAIYKRDNYACNLCKTDLKETPAKRRIDHKVPLDKLGSNEEENLWLLCDECDTDKKNDLNEMATNSYIEKRISVLSSKIPAKRASHGRK